MEDPSTPIPSSLWSSLNSWFTSTVFFVLLNLMIATIVFTSNLPDNNSNNNNNQQQEQQDQDNKKNPQLVRSPSILHRLKSFNLYPQKTQQDSYSEPHYHQHPLEVAATNYVFEQPDYQHFNTSFVNSDQTHEPHVHDTGSRAQHVTDGYDFDQIYKTGKDTDTDTDADGNAAFTFDPTRQETRRYKAFNVDPTRNQTHEDTGFDFDPTRKEKRRSKGFDSDPTRNQIREDTGLGFDPTRKERGRNKGFEFDPTRDDTGMTRPEIGNNDGSGFEGFDEEQNDGDELQSLDEVYSRLKGGGHDRTKSDGSIRQKAPAKMKKSASLKVGFTDSDEVEKMEARRPATVKEKRSKVKVVADDDVEVDSRADDFINKFKNDLMLQRMESIIRTKGATNRGGGK